MHSIPHHVSQLVAISAIACIVPGLYLCRLGWKNQQKHEYLNDPPLVWINGIPWGFIHVRGRAVLDRPFTSPLTQSPCCYHRVTIERVKSNDAGSYRRVSDEKKSKEFYIDDGTGRILVDPRGADYSISRTYSAELDATRPGIREVWFVSLDGRGADPPEERLRRYLAERGVAGAQGTIPQGPHADGTTVTYRLTEFCLQESQEVSVFGTCSRLGSGIDANSNQLIRKASRFPTLVISSSHELKVAPRWRHTAIACFTSGVLAIGLALAGMLLLIYPEFV